MGSCNRGPLISVSQREKLPGRGVLPRRDVLGLNPRAYIKGRNVGRTRTHGTERGNNQAMPWEYWVTRNCGTNPAAVGRQVSRTALVPNLYILPPWPFYTGAPKLTLRGGAPRSAQPSLWRTSYSQQHPRIIRARVRLSTISQIPFTSSSRPLPPARPFEPVARHPARRLGHPPPPSLLMAPGSRPGRMRARRAPHSQTTDALSTNPPPRVLLPVAELRRCVCTGAHTTWLAAFTQSQPWPPTRYKASAPSYSRK